jgi:hypothetical protein
MRENRPAVLIPSFRQAPKFMADAAARFSYERLSDDGALWCTVRRSVGVVPKTSVKTR